MMQVLPDNKTQDRQPTSLNVNAANIGQTLTALTESSTDALRATGNGRVHCPGPSGANGCTAAVAILTICPKNSRFERVSDPIPVTD